MGEGKRENLALIDLFALIGVMTVLHGLTLCKCCSKCILLIGVFGI